MERSNFVALMFAAFHDQLAAGLAAQLLQHIHLLIESLRPPLQAGFGELSQLLFPVPCAIGFLARTGDRLAAIQRLIRPMIRLVSSVSVA